MENGVPAEATTGLTHEAKSGPASQAHDTGSGTSERVAVAEDEITPIGPGPGKKTDIASENERRGRM